VIFVVSYLAWVAGSDRRLLRGTLGRPFPDCAEFGAVVMALAALALMGTLLRTSRRRI